VSEHATAGPLSDQELGFGHRAAYLRQDMQERLIRQWHYACEHGEDTLEIQNWVWPH
jgi:phosphoketolase